MRHSTAFSASLKVWVIASLSPFSSNRFLIASWLLKGAFHFCRSTADLRIFQINPGLLAPDTATCMSHYDQRTDLYNSGLFGSTETRSMPRCLSVLKLFRVLEKKVSSPVGTAMCCLIC